MSAFVHALRKSFPRMLCGLLLCVFAAALPARAHKVNVYAVVQGDTVVGESYFAGGGKPQNVAVELHDAQGRVLASARTGQDGTFRIPLPEAAQAPLRVVLKAGDGHQNDYTLTAEDLGHAQPPGPAATPQAPQPQPVGPAARAVVAGGPEQGQSTAPPQAGAPLPPASGAAALDEARLSALVEAAAARAVAEQLAPLKVQVAKLAARDGSPGLKDIIAGMGWIMGLIGLAAWLKRPRG